MWTITEIQHHKKVRYALIGISIMALAACAALMLPRVQKMILDFAEAALLGRKIRNRVFWSNYLFGLGYGTPVLFILVLYFFILRKKIIVASCFLVSTFAVYLFLYQLLYKTNQAHDRLRFPLFVLLSVIILHWYQWYAGRSKTIHNYPHKNKIIHSPFFIFGCGTLIGALFFLRIFGTAILDCTYTNWLLNGGDLAQHYLGWRLFRNSDWYFPFGLMDNIVYPFKESIIYTDSIPLFAIFFKLLSPVLPVDFQYFGLFGLLCYMLQGGIASLIVREIGGSTIQSIIASMFFTFSTVMMQRIFGHTALSAHFIILLCILVTFQKHKRSGKRQTVVWSSLLCLSASIHLYFVLMVTLFMLFYLLREYLLSKNAGKQLLIFGISFSALIITMFCLGAFYSHAVVYAGGLGRVSANLNSFFNPMDGSLFLKNLPSLAGQYEGYSYLGLGIILALVIVIVSQLNKQDKCSLKSMIQIQKLFPYALGLVLSFVLFSLSPTVTFNQYKLFTYPVIRPVEHIWSIFRSTGRMTWPIVYIIISFCVWWIITKYSSRKAAVLLCVLLAVQCVDLFPFFINKGNTFKSRKERPTELPDPVWKRLANDYSHIFFLGAYDHKKTFSFQDLAAANTMTLNDAYLARKNTTIIELNKQNEIEYVQNNGPRDDTIYVFESRKQVSLLYNADIRFYIIDDVIIGIHSEQDYLDGHAFDL